MNFGALEVAFSATALIVSVVVLVFGWKTMRVRVKDYEERRRSEQRANLRAHCLPSGAGTCRIEVHNDGPGTARNIRFRMDGFTLAEPRHLKHNPEEVTELPPHDSFHYRVSYGMGSFDSPRGEVQSAGPWKVELSWEDDSGESNQYEKLVQCLQA